MPSHDLRGSFKKVVKIFSEFRDLAELQFIGNSLAGPIGDVGNLRSMRVLLLRDNELTGPLTDVLNFLNVLYTGS